MFSGNFAPRGWAFCDGELLAISQNDALFSILGTTYGGDGRSTFGLPDLRGRAAMHKGTGAGLTPRQLGQKTGAEIHTLTINELPSHTHDHTDITIKCNNDPAAPNSDTPKDHYIGDVAGTANNKLYSDAPENNKFMAKQSLDLPHSGASTYHDNMQPYNTVNYIISLVGEYPSRS